VTRRLLPLVLLALLSACSADASDVTAPATSTVRVAAAADLRFALDEVADVVAREHPGVELAVSYGSSGTFLQQIANGAPYDLYLSADLAYPQRLVDDGLADQADLFRYAVGRLVLWTIDPSRVDVGAGLAGLADQRVRKVAVANPEHAPYGVAALAALDGAGVADSVRPRLVLGENVAQAAEFVQNGGADVGIVAKSLVLSPPLRDVGRWVDVPLDAFPRLEQGGVVLRRAGDVDAARAVRDALLGAEGRAVLARYGFELPEQ
jgi:molybdate transport system substrate-binding protein